jgi:hypothetical protein
MRIALIFAAALLAFFCWSAYAAPDGFGMDTKLQIDLAALSLALVVFLLFLLLWQAGRRGLSCLDLVTDKGSGKMSLAKVLNVVGGVGGTWVVLRMAMDKTLTAEIFFTWLLYCASIHVFSTYFGAKFKPGEGAKDGDRT